MSTIQVCGLHLKYKKEIGAGKFAKVDFVSCLDDQRPACAPSDTFEFALKTVNVAEYTLLSMACAELELTQHKRFEHPHIVRCYASERGIGEFYLLLELCDGSLKDRVPRKPVPEYAVRAWMRQLLLAVEYLHALHFIHCDIKPENILLKDGCVKLADMGFLTRYDGAPIKRRRGSPYFMAPELCGSDERRLALTPKADIWSVGVVSYRLLCGKLPFRAENQELLFREILALNYVRPKEAWKDISQNADRFIQALFTTPYVCRVTASVALQLDFLKYS